MAQVTVRINGYAYSIGCQDGEEPHLLAMADQVEERVIRAKALGSQSGEARLLVMAALFMADELHDMAIELRQVEEGVPDTRPAAPPALPRPDPARLARLAARAEEIAATLEEH